MADAEAAKKKKAEEEKGREDFAQRCEVLLNKEVELKQRAIQLKEEIIQAGEERKHVKATKKSKGYFSEEQMKKVEKYLESSPLPFINLGGKDAVKDREKGQYGSDRRGRQSPYQKDRRTRF
jgi:hypothetical protein